VRANDTNDCPHLAAQKKGLDKATDEVSRGFVATLQNGNRKNAQDSRVLVFEQFLLIFITGPPF